LLRPPLGVYTKSGFGTRLRESAPAISVRTVIKGNSQAYEGPSPPFQQPPDRIPASFAGEENLHWVEASLLSSALSIPCIFPQPLEKSFPEAPVFSLQEITPTPLFSSTNVPSPPHFETLFCRLWEGILKSLASKAGGPFGICQISGAPQESFLKIPLQEPPPARVTTRLSSMHSFSASFGLPRQSFFRSKTRQEPSYFPPTLLQERCFPIPGGVSPLMHSRSRQFLGQIVSPPLPAAPEIIPLFPNFQLL